MLPRAADLPLLWPEILRTVSGLDADLQGEDVILSEIMTDAGFKRLKAYLRDNPTPNLETWKKVVTAFLGKYVDEAKVDEEIALPGWTQDVIAALSAAYEADVARIASMGNIRFLAP